MHLDSCQHTHPVSPSTVEEDRAQRQIWMGKDGSRYHILEYDGATSLEAILV